MIGLDDDNISAISRGAKVEVSIPPKPYTKASTNMLLDLD